MIIYTSLVCEPISPAKGRGSGQLGIYPVVVPVHCKVCSLERTEEKSAVTSAYHSINTKLDATYI